MIYKDIKGIFTKEKQKKKKRKLFTKIVGNSSYTNMLFLLTSFLDDSIPFLTVISYICKMLQL